MEENVEAQKAGEENVEAKQAIEDESKSFIRSLEPEDTVWFINAVQGMILADKRVDEGEINFIRRLIELISDKKEAGRLVESIKKRKAAELAYAGNMNREVAFNMLTTLLNIALSDGKLGQPEAEYFKTACRQLGFDAILSKEMLAWAKKKQEADMLYERLKHLIQGIKGNFKSGQQEEPEAKEDAPEEEGEKKLVPKKNCLLGKYVSCQICKHPDIPFWILRSKTMQSHTNVFGVTIYDKAREGKDFCDYNLIQVATCPKCLFASNDYHYFYNDNKMTDAFDPEKMADEWMSTLPARMENLPIETDFLNAEERSLKNTLLSYNFAIQTFEKIYQTNGKQPNLLKLVSLKMIQAELFISNHQREEAEANLKTVAKALVEIFEHLDGETIFRSAALLCFISMYFKDYGELAKYMGFLKNYVRRDEMDPSSAEYRAYKIANSRVAEAYLAKEDYGSDKLNGFHLV